MPLPTSGGHLRLSHRSLGIEDAAPRELRQYQKVAHQIDIAMVAHSVLREEDMARSRALGTTLDAITKLTLDVKQIKVLAECLQVPLGL